MSGLARLDASPPAAPRLLFTAPYNSEARRANLTAFTSGGLAPPGLGSWALSALGPLWSQDAAYSDALQINATHVGVLFECGTGGDFAARINFLALPLVSL